MLHPTSALALCLPCFWSEIFCKVVNRKLKTSNFAQDMPPKKKVNATKKKAKRQEPEDGDIDSEGVMTIKVGPFKKDDAVAPTGRGGSAGSSGEDNPSKGLNRSSRSRKAVKPDRPEVTTPKATPTKPKSKPRVLSTSSKGASSRKAGYVQVV